MFPANAPLQRSYIEWARPDLQVVWQRELPKHTPAPGGTQGLVGSGAVVTGIW